MEPDRDQRPGRERDQQADEQCQLRHDRPWRISRGISRERAQEQVEGLSPWRAPQSSGRLARSVFDRDHGPAQRRELRDPQVGAAVGDRASTPRAAPRSEPGSRAAGRPRPSRAPARQARPLHLRRRSAPVLARRGGAPSGRSSNVTERSRVVAVDLQGVVPGGRRVDLPVGERRLSLSFLHSAPIFKA